MANYHAYVPHGFQLGLVLWRIRSELISGTGLCLWVGIHYKCSFIVCLQNRELGSFAEHWSIMVLLRLFKCGAFLKQPNLVLSARQFGNLPNTEKWNKSRSSVWCPCQLLSRICISIAQLKSRPVTGVTRVSTVRSVCVRKHVYTWDCLY